MFIMSVPHNLFLSTRAITRVEQAEGGTPTLPLPPMPPAPPMPPSPVVVNSVEPAADYEALEDAAVDEVYQAPAQEVREPQPTEQQPTEQQKENPQTGDFRNYSLVALVVVVMAGAVATLKATKKTNEEKDN